MLIPSKNKTAQKALQGYISRHGRRVFRSYIYYEWVGNARYWVIVEDAPQGPRLIRYHDLKQIRRAHPDYPNGL